MKNCRTFICYSSTQLKSVPCVFPLYGFIPHHHWVGPADIYAVLDIVATVMKKIPSCEIEKIKFVLSSNNLNQTGCETWLILLLTIEELTVLSDDQLARSINVCPVAPTSIPKEYNLPVESLYPIHE